MKFKFLLLATSFLLCACGSEALRDNTNSAGSTLPDIRYQMVLSNIAMLRFYATKDHPNPKISPSDFHVTTGTIAVNDSEGVTPGITAGAAHGVVSPSFSMPLTRTLQQQWTAVPTVDPAILTALRDLYANEEQANGKIYHYCPMRLAPPGKLAGTYRDAVVWIDNDDISHLTDFIDQIDKKLNSIPSKPAPATHIVMDPTTPPKSGTTNAAPVESLLQRQTRVLELQQQNSSTQPVININPGASR